MGPAAKLMQLDRDSGMYKMAEYWKPFAMMVIKALIVTQTRSLRLYYFRLKSVFRTNLP